MFFNFVFILSFGCFDGSLEIVTGLFPIVSVSRFKGRCPRWQGWSLLIHGFWLGQMQIVLVGTTSFIHFLVKHVTISEYASMSSSDAARNMSQSTWSKQSCSIVYDWSDQHWIVLRAGASRFSFCLLAGRSRMEEWFDLPKGGQGRDLYASRKGE